MGMAFPASLPSCMRGGVRGRVAHQLSVPGVQGGGSSHPELTWLHQLADDSIRGGEQEGSLLWGSFEARPRKRWHRHGPGEEGVRGRSRAPGAPKGPGSVAWRKQGMLATWCSEDSAGRR